MLLHEASNQTAFAWALSLLWVLVGVLIGVLLGEGVLAIVEGPDSVSMSVQ